IPGIPRGHEMKDPTTGKTGGYQPERNPTFKKFTTRTMRPVVDFDTCIKCTLCWLHCPDSVFDVTADGLYDANMEACCGCGVCEEVCPVAKCVTMVNETQFANNDSQWEAWRENKEGYKSWDKEKIADPPERSHGFRFRGQYQEEVPEMLKIAKEGGERGSPIMTEALAPPPQTQPAADKTSLITGSEAIAVACKLADVDVITAYPIRPYDTVMQYV